jgi:hypothetical protein
MWVSRFLLMLALALPAVAKVTAGSFFKDNFQWVLLDTFVFNSADGVSVVTELA